MDRERVFVMVIGTDKKSIIARVSTLLFEHGANITALTSRTCRRRSWTAPSS